MKPHAILILTFLTITSHVAVSQTNLFPLFSSGTYSAGTNNDYTDITNAQLKLRATSGYVRIPHVSADAAVSTVYNFEAGKHVYWGESADGGQYIFRGRDMVIQNGKIGIGGDPTHPFTIQSQASNTEVQANIFNPSNQTGAVAGIRFHTGSSWNVMLRTRQDKAWLELANSLGVVTHYWENGNYFATGKIAIGTTDTPGNHRLYVNGSTITTEVNVALKSAWPDYVFRPDYRLTPLNELENYLHTYGHLPETPTESDVKENGINLGEMNALLLKKVEELTLHLIEANKKIESLDKQVQSLKNNTK